MVEQQARIATNYSTDFTLTPDTQLGAETNHYLFLIRLPIRPSHDVAYCLKAIATATAHSSLLQALLQGFEVC